MSDLGIPSGRATDPLRPTTRVESELGGAKTENQATVRSETIQRSGTQRIADGEQWAAEIPVRVLKEPNLMRAEHGWRSLLTQQGLEGQLGSQVVTGSRTDEFITQTTSAVQLLWTLLEELSAAHGADKAVGVVNPENLHLSSEAPDGPLIPFASILSTESGLADPMKHRILKDRMVSAVEQSGQPKVGDGLFVLPVGGFYDVRSDRASKGDNRRTVYWHGERRSDTQSDGRTVHRLRMDLTIENQRVEVTFLACAPSLTIHIGTNHAGIAERLEHTGPLHGVLSSLGWQLERWSIGPWTGTEQDD